MVKVKVADESKSRINALARALSHELTFNHLHYDGPLLFSQFFDLSHRDWI